MCRQGIIQNQKEDKKPNRLTENIETENRASLEVFLRDARFLFSVRNLSRLRPAYFATLSSHFSMNSMVNIEIQHATTNTVQVIQIGIDSYNTAPMNSNWLPIAVAPSHPPA